MNLNRDKSFQIETWGGVGAGVGKKSQHKACKICGTKSDGTSKKEIKKKKN